MSVRIFTQDLELYRQFSQDLPKMGIAMLIAFAPGGVLVFPIAYLFPRHLLSHHFWTAQQKEEFAQLRLRKQLRHYSVVLGLLEKRLLRLPSGEDRLALQGAIRKLNSTTEVTAKEVLGLKHIFEGRPFGLDFLSFRHRYHVAQCLGMPYLRRPRLVREALLLRSIDMAMLKEGKHNMADEEIDMACIWRGLNPQGVDREQKLDFLWGWTAVTAMVHEPSLSLLLHLPVLLSLTQPSNQRLLQGPLTVTETDKDQG